MSDRPPTEETPARTPEGSGPWAWWRRRSEMEKLGVFAVVVVAAAAIWWVATGDVPSIIGGQEETAEQPVETTSTTAPVPRETYEDEARDVPYAELAADPAAYDGEFLSLTGEVIEVQIDQGIAVARIATGTTSDGGYDEDEFIVAGYQGMEELTEGEVVSFYADGLGSFDYTTDEGETLTVPSVLIKYFQE